MAPRPIIIAALTITAVMGLSILSATLWDAKPEKLDLPEFTITATDITAAALISNYNLPAQPVFNALGVSPERASTTTLSELGLSGPQAQMKIRKTLIKYYEEQSKDWRKIAAKFLLWFLILPIPFVLLLRKKVNPRNRLFLTGAGILIFGIALGSDPSPMGTVKDAIFLITAHQTVFVPRIVALAIFLLTVVIANKFICSWGCQFGLLQEFLFRLNRHRFDRKGILPQYKPPFWLTNFIRVAVFVTVALIGGLWAFDIIGVIDPFKIYHPAVLTGVGIGFLLILLASSLVTYRPWCHFACPFGLVSWIFEKLAIFRIKVDYNKCDACQLCYRSCPSNVMESIIKQDKRTIPDCFSCGTCIDVCPQDAVRFTSKRTKTGTWPDALNNRTAKRRKRANRTL